MEKTSNNQGGTEVSDPVQLIRTSRMSGFQFRAVAIFFLLYVIDGYDLLAFAFALMLKDIGIAVDLARDTHTPVPMWGVGQQL
jgi:3-hydroxyisobutyrate dehydrogenase-like beta-hydroxyacid dehydrogenase